jgi:cytochrome c peroxidase
MRNLEALAWSYRTVAADFVMKKFGDSTDLKTWEREGRGIIVASLGVVIIICSLFLSATAQAITASEAIVINQGFQIFTTQTFDGNGRTCSTCHLPQADFTISPADIPTLSAHDRTLVFAANVGPGKAGSGSLENQTLVQKLGLFNINEGVNGLSTEVGTGNNPTGPFRASMTIAGLAFTTLNFLPDFCSSNSPPTLIVNAALDNLVNCLPLPAPFPSPANKITLPDVFTNDDDNVAPGSLTPGPDEGTRNIELGWAGDAVITDPNIFLTSGPLDAADDCQAAVNAANADTTDLTKSLNVFSLTAVKTHLTRTLNRVPGVDFRCPTSAELNALSAFQEYLGRRFELALRQGVMTDAYDNNDADDPSVPQLQPDFYDLGTQTDPSQPVITFNDGTAEKGKAIFLNENAQCNLCHFNAGANGSSGAVHAPNANDPSAPFPGRNFTSAQQVDLLRCADTNANTNDPKQCGTPTNAHGLDSIVTPVFIPEDPGDKVSSAIGAISCEPGNGNIFCSGGKLKAAGFNIQPLIEAARKKSFFHNGAFNTLEGAISFYFSPTADKIGVFRDPRKTEGGAAALSALANTYFSNPSDTQDVFNTLGFFLRALSTVYAIADCERLMQDAIDLSILGQPTALQVQLCTGELNDVDNLVAGAKVPVPPQYLLVAGQAQNLVSVLNATPNNVPIGQLIRVLVNLKIMRHSIATITPQLP